MTVHGSLLPIEPGSPALQANSLLSEPRGKPRKPTSLVTRVGKEAACSAGDKGDGGSVPESGRSSGEGNGNPLQYSCLENLMDRGAWQTTVHRVAKQSDTA